MVNDLDLLNIRELYDQVLALSEYRAQLYTYLKSRKNTIAPNLTALVGELIGARLISHGGSLMNLAKQPGSTIPVLGAENALFSVLKTKHDTPKYGLQSTRERFLVLLLQKLLLPSGMMPLVMVKITTFPFVLRVNSSLKHGLVFLRVKDLGDLQVRPRESPR